MKKTLIALALAAVIPVAFAAGGDHGPRGRGLDRMTEHLDLTVEQRALIEDLFEQQRAKREAMREEMRAQIAEVLDAEQRTKMDEMRAKHEERRERHAERRARHHKDCAGDAAKES